MSSKSKLLATTVMVASLLSACGSAQSATDNKAAEATTTTSVPAEIVEGAKKLQLKQKWNGNSVSVALYDSKGQNCASLSGIEGEECFGYYFGWSANFEDKDRVVEYEDLTTISSLQVGDKGNFILLHQASDNSNQYYVDEYPFAYNG
jgi:hypothetical protein